MGILFGRRPDYDGAVERAESALRPQVRKLLALDSSNPRGMEKLCAGTTLCLLHGFITFYSSKHRLKEPQIKLAATLDVFIRLFGEPAAAKMIEQLQEAMRDSSNWMYLEEGEEAAKHFERSGINLVAAFLGDHTL